MIQGLGAIGPGDTTLPEMTNPNEVVAAVAKEGKAGFPTQRDSFETITGLYIDKYINIYVYTLDKK